MKLTNVSKIGEIHVLVLNSPEGKVYWTGGTEFSKDVSLAEQLGTGAAMHFMTTLGKQGFDVTCEVIEGDIQFIKYAGTGWAVVNHRNWPVTIHRAYYTGAYGDGWFMEGEGSIERKLCINRSNGTYVDITVRGREVISAIIRTDGETFDKWSILSIPCDSDLTYQFSFDPTPLDPSYWNV